MEGKGIPDTLGTNLTYLLHLCQVEDNTSIPRMWMMLTELPKHQQLTTLL